jgi:type IV secretory pathway VirB2 component (pilin)
LIASGIVLARAGIALKGWERVARWMVWVVVAFSAVSLVLNLITPSAGERMLWAPVALVLLVCSLLVATGPKP